MRGFFIVFVCLFIKVLGNVTPVAFLLELEHGWVGPDQVNYRKVQICLVPPE